MQYYEGDYVTFKCGGVSGAGYICGIAITEQPLIGAGYIIRIESSTFDKTIYPFSCLCVFSYFISSHTRRPDYVNPEG